MRIRPINKPTKIPNDQRLGMRGNREVTLATSAIRIWGRVGELQKICLQKQEKKNKKKLVLKSDSYKKGYKIKR